MTLPLIRPDVTFDEVADDLRAILASGRLTSGRYVEAFEAELAATVGVGHAVATTSATTAMHLTLAALGIGPGDEVLVSDFTFPATGNVVVQTGARPVLVDSLPGRFELDPADADRRVTDRTRAILAVDPFGQPADLDALTALAEARGMALIEDAACALGAAVGDRPCGAFGIAGCFSFHPRKVVTTGEGGAVTTDDGALAAHLRRLRSHGGEAVPGAVGLSFVEPGFNYRLSEIPAAIGLAQLRRLGAIVADRRRTAAEFRHRLAGVPGLAVPGEPPGRHFSYQSFVVVLDEHVDRDGLVARLSARGIESTLGTYALHAQPAYARYGYRPGDLPHSWAAQARSLTLPLVPRMPADDVARVVDALEAELSAVLR